MRNGFGGWPAGIAVVLIVALALTAWAADMPPAAAGDARTLEHQGVERHYYLHNAEAAAAAPVPLVVRLHGYRDPEQAVAEREDLSVIAWPALDRVAGREGFVVAYPHAWRGQWSLFEGVENAALEDGRTVDDVGFVARMIERLVDEGLADPGRVYLTGFSDGAIMSFKLLCTAEAPFAAAAPVAGTMHQIHRDTCAARVPIPLLVIAGTDDRSLPYDGWLFPTGRELSIPETMEHFRLLHGCTGQTSDLLYDRTARTAAESWRSHGPVVRWRTPSRCFGSKAAATTRRASSRSPTRGRAWAGVRNRDIESAEEIWAFMRRFERRPSDARPTARAEQLEYDYAYESSARSIRATCPSSPTACGRACGAISWARGGPRSCSRPARAAAWPGRGAAVGPPRRHISATSCSSASTTGGSPAVSLP